MSSNPFVNPDNATAAVIGAIPRQEATAMFVTTRQNGDYVVSGDIVTDFRGNRAEFLAATRAQSPGKSGKVLVRWLDGPGTGNSAEYYDMVFGLTVKEIS